MHEPSALADTQWLSSATTLTEVTGPLCSFRVASSVCFARDTSHTRTRPSLPPLTICWPLLVVVSAVTPSVCASVITNCSLPLCEGGPNTRWAWAELVVRGEGRTSGANARILPSDQPEMMLDPSGFTARLRHSRFGT
jgi:hypothetical protein